MKNVLVIILMFAFCFSPLMAETPPTTIDEDDLVSINLGLKSLAKGIGIGLVVSGAAAGIGAIGAATVEAIARQPEASDMLTRAMNTGVFVCVGLAVGAVVTTLFF